MTHTCFFHTWILSFYNYNALIDLKKHIVSNQVCQVSLSFEHIRYNLTEMGAKDICEGRWWTSYMAPYFRILKSLCSVGYQTNHLSLHYSSWGFLQPIKWGIKVTYPPKTRTYSNQSISTFFEAQTYSLPLAGLQLLQNNHKDFVWYQQPASWTNL